MEKAAAIRRTRELYTGLNRLILEWDPLGASWGGQVADEFSDEVWALLDLLCDVGSEEETVQAVEKVFTPLQPHLQCYSVGERVWEWWSREP